MQAARGVSASALALGFALVGSFSTDATALEGDGISVEPGSSLWARWQGRVSVGSAAAGLRSPVSPLGGYGFKLNTLSVLGDYYFGNSPANASARGFRATSGLLIGARSSLSLADSAVNGLAPRSNAFERHAVSSLVPLNGVEAQAETGAVPYFGVGYSGISPKSGWGFSADVGLMALSPSSAVKLGRVFSGSQSLDDTLRDLRLSPVLQLGVSYSF